MQLCRASMTASEGILVEHPGWKYDCGITGSLGGGREWRNWLKVMESGERAGERLAVRERRHKKNYRHIFFLNIFIVWVVPSISEIYKREKPSRQHISSEDCRRGYIHSSQELELISIPFLIRIEMQLYYQVVEGWRKAWSPAAID